VHIKRPELWSNGWILHDSAPAYKVCSVKQFLAKKMDYWSGTPTLFPDLAQIDFLLFEKVKSALKGLRFQDIEDKKKNWQHWKLVHSRSSKNVSSSGLSLG
jgi:hypothetical protein